MEFARNVMLAPHIYARYNLPAVAFSTYEYFQVGVMVLQVGFLIVRAGHLLLLNCLCVLMLTPRLVA